MLLYICGKEIHYTKTKIKRIIKSWLILSLLLSLSLFTCLATLHLFGWCWTHNKPQKLHSPFQTGLYCPVFLCGKAHTLGGVGGWKVEWELEIETERAREKTTQRTRRRIPQADGTNRFTTPWRLCTVSTYSGTINILVGSCVDVLMYRSTHI